jgi:hypothetical protein
MSSPIFFSERPSSPILGASDDAAPTSPPVTWRRIWHRAEDAVNRKLMEDEEGTRRERVVLAAPVGSNANEAETGVREIEGLGQEMHALFRGSCRIGCWVRVAVSVMIR